MQVKNETRTGLTAEIKIVPAWAWTLAVVGFAIAQLFFNVVMARHQHAPPAWCRALMGLAAGTVMGCYLLLVGYVNRDARRRGMSSILWTLVAIFIPHGLGLILYFILRQPERSACPQCGNAVQTGFNFCPGCNYKLGPSCPQCQRVVGVNDVYCPYCGTSLRNQAAP
jgi:RNA polymerase subunit RPABC4/transcription elongation factor Spt4